MSRTAALAISKAFLLVVVCTSCGSALIAACSSQQGGCSTRVPGCEVCFQLHHLPDEVAPQSRISSTCAASHVKGCAAIWPEWGHCSLADLALLLALLLCCFGHPGQLQERSGAPVAWHCLRALNSSASMASRSSSQDIP